MATVVVLNREDTYNYMKQSTDELKYECLVDWLNPAVEYDQALFQRYIPRSFKFCILKSVKLGMNLVRRSIFQHFPIFYSL